MCNVHRKKEIERERLKSYIIQNERKQLKPRPFFWLCTVTSTLHIAHCITDYAVHVKSMIKNDHTICGNGLDHAESAVIVQLVVSECAWARTQQSLAITANELKAAIY